MREYVYRQKNASDSNYRILIYEEVIQSKDDPTKSTTNLFEQIYFE